MQREDDRGQTSTGAVAIIVSIAVAAIIASFLLPVAVNQLENDESVTINQSVSSTEDVNAQVNATLDSIGTKDPTDNATYTLQTDNQSITKTIDNGSESTFSFNEGDVTVNVSDVDSGTSSAESAFTYPTTFGYSSGGAALYDLLGLALILAAFLFFVGLATSRL